MGSFLAICIDIPTIIVAMIHISGISSSEETPMQQLIPKRKTLYHAFTQKPAPQNLNPIKIADNPYESRKFSDSA